MLEFTFWSPARGGPPLGMNSWALRPALQQGPAHSLSQPHPSAENAGSRGAGVSEGGSRVCQGAGIQRWLYPPLVCR